MIYGDFLSLNEQKGYNKLSRDRIDIIIYTDADLTTPIHFINENQNNSDKNEDIEAVRINLDVYVKNTDCILHLRNKRGASKQNTDCKHGPTVKFIKNGLTPKEGIPILVSTGKVIRQNIDPKIANKIDGKFGIIGDIIKSDENITKLWNAKNKEEAKECVMNFVKSKSNKKLKMTFINNEEDDKDE